MPYSFSVFLLLLAAILIIVKPPIRDIFKKRLRPVSSKVIMQQKRNQIVQKKASLIERHRRNVIRIAEEAQVESFTWERYLQYVAICMMGGALFGLLFSNAILSGVMALICPCIPYQWLLIKKVNYNRFLYMQIESSLGIITNSYNQSDDLAMAVQMNLPRIEEPLHHILSDFVNDIRVGTNAIMAIEKMNSRVDNSQWHKWCELLIQCQTDRTMKVLLPPMIAQLSAIRGIQAETDTIMQNIWQEHIIISLLVVGAVPAVRLLNYEWFLMLTQTVVGKIIVCLAYVVVLIATIAVVRINKPISMEV